MTINMTALLWPATHQGKGWRETHRLRDTEHTQEQAGWKAEGERLRHAQSRNQWRLLYLTSEGVGLKTKCEPVCIGSLD